MAELPLSALTAEAGSWPAARLAGELLAALGARVEMSDAPAGVSARPSSPGEDWEATGLSAVTGRPNGPALTPHGRPATLARALGIAIETLGGPPIDGSAELGARIDRLAPGRGGTRSAGGAARLLACADGWVALSLPRGEDRALVPALVGEAVAGDPWTAAGGWSATRRVRDVVARAALLGLAVGGLGERVAESAPPWTLTAFDAPGAVARPASPRRVVNLGALWAGPLAAQLLHRAGAEVTDVVAASRPDPAPPVRNGRLHAGHLSRRIDLSDGGGRRELAALLAGADVVIEASRPRALRQLGLDAAAVMSDGRRRTWLRITGHGPGSERIAFGDDAAVAGGLVGADGDGPVFAGDAIADPLSGLTAALLALACARSPRAWIADVPMAAVAATAARGDVDRVVGTVASSP